MTKVLVTGFTPFPGAPENPCLRLLEAIENGEITYPKSTGVLAKLLPTEFERSVSNLSELIDSLLPEAVIEFGLSHKATGFTLETVARNEFKQGTPDNTGFKPESLKIDDKGEDLLPTTLPVMAIYDGLKEKCLPVEFSDNAGGYVCNHLFYNTQAMPMAQRPRLTGFIHIPYLEEQRDRLEAEGRIDEGLFALTEEQLLSGVETILSIVARELL